MTFQPCLFQYISVCVCVCMSLVIVSFGDVRSSVRMMKLVKVLPLQESVVNAKTRGDNSRQVKRQSDLKRLDKVHLKVIRVNFDVNIYWNNLIRENRFKSTEMITLLVVFESSLSYKTYHKRNYANHNLSNEDNGADGNSMKLSHASVLPSKNKVR